MPVENPAANHQQESDPKKIFAAKEVILATWQQLPEEHQATMVLVLLDDVMKGEQRAWLREALVLRWPLQTNELASAFPVVQLTRKDLVQACLTQEEIGLLTDEDLHLVAQTMRNHHVHDVFWPELEYVVTDLLEKKRQRPFQERLEAVTAVDGDYFAWMNQIDRYVWTLAGCSVYDLQDFDSRPLFTSGATAEEVANQVLDDAGFDLFSSTE